MGEMATVTGTGGVVSNLTRDGRSSVWRREFGVGGDGREVRSRYRYLFVKTGALGQVWTAWLRTAPRHGSVHCAVQRRLLLLGFAV